MDKKNLVIKKNMAFYDSVKYGEPLVNRKQSKQWFEDLSADSIESLYILTKNNSYYKQTKTGISLIKFSDYKNEFLNSEEAIKNIFDTQTNYKTQTENATAKKIETADTTENKIISVDKESLKEMIKEVLKEL